MAFVKASSADIRRYKSNYIEEQDGIALYRALVNAEKDSQKSEIFRKLAVAEERHAARWAKLLQENGVAVPRYRPSARVRLLGWMARVMGPQHVLPVISRLESNNQG